MNKKVLTKAQQGAVEEIYSNLQLIACAGSGKTEVISRRIAYILKQRKDVSPQNIVAFTFTEKAAESLKSRIARVLGENEKWKVERMYVGTIHGFCWKLLSTKTELFNDFKILDTVKNHLFVERYAKECGMIDLALEPYFNNVKLFLECIDKMIDDYDNRAEWDSVHSVVLDKYINCLYQKKYIDFSLIIFETLRQIKTSKKIQDYLKSIKYLVVDEYQDINDIQEKLIASIVNQGANICVVGDDDQTIYQFRGSNANNMIGFSQRYDGVRQIRLENNFRCAPEIVDVANTVIQNNGNRLEKSICTDKAYGNATVKAMRYDSESEQYDGIANFIIDKHNQGIPYKEIAVLTRKGKYVSKIVSALEQLNIPYVADSSDYFFEGDYFNRFVDTIKILANLDKPRLIEIWKDILDNNLITRGFRYLRSASGTLQDILMNFLQIVDFCNSDVEDLEVRQNALKGICDILSDYEEIYIDYQLSARIDGLIDFLDNYAAEEYKYHNFIPQNEENDEVRVMTVHKSKGLEFDTVFLPNIMMSEFPAQNRGGKKYWHVLGGSFEENKDKYQSNIEDERKLFYVALTRAKSNLYISYQLSKKPVSLFVEEMAETDSLIINREDLCYDPREEKRRKCIEHSIKRRISYDIDYSDDITVSIRNEEEHRQNREYWQLVKKAKSKLYDYYGSGARFMPAMYSELSRIKNMDPDDIIAEARRLGMI